MGWNPSDSDLVIPGHHPAAALDGRYPEALSGQMPSVLILLGQWPSVLILLGKFMILFEGRWPDVLRPILERKNAIIQVVVEGEFHRGGAGLLGEHQGRVHQCEKDAP